MLISVIIPTYNRAAILKECLAALMQQSLPCSKYEIIVVDDGSKDDTKKIVAEEKQRNKNILYLKQKNRGQGIARNLGINKAKGELIVFIGDDIIVKKDFLEQHLKFHLRYSKENHGVLGFTTWDPRIPISPLMSWLTNGSSILGKFGGHQFAYEKLKHSEPNFNFFYTSNISLKAALLKKFPFDPEFSGYGWEDIELGYRLHKRVGLKLHYNKQAIGFHYHVMTEKDLKKRMIEIGSSALIMQKKYPELKKVPKGAKKIIFKALSSDFSIAALELVRGVSQGYFSALYFYALSKKYFLEGLNNNQ
jgi:glycosyltransferase involved in cell wall biosynthesis